MTKGTSFIATAIDTVNCPPHVGTAYEKILADVFARWRRLNGEQVRFAVGNDEHCQTVADRAAELGLEPMEYCDRMEDEYRECWGRLNISFDTFIRTSSPAHHLAAQEVYRRLRDKGELTEGLFWGLYCVGCEDRKTLDELVDGSCPDHRTIPLKLLSEKNFFFRMSRQGDRLRSLVKEGNFIEPADRAGEILSEIDRGVEDVSISRRGKAWGVPVPDDPEQRFYVWFEALLGLATAAGFPDDPDRFAGTWPPDRYFVGRDIVRFPAVVLPALMMASGLEPPKKLLVHGLVTVKKGGDTVKMSKSLGTAVDPRGVADRVGTDALRYFLLRGARFGQDLEFDEGKVLERARHDLVDGLGSGVNHVFSMVERHLGGRLDGTGSPGPGDAMLKGKALGLADRVAPMMERLEFDGVLEGILDLARAIEGHVEGGSPGPLYYAAESLRILGTLLYPFLPETARRILEQLGQGGRTPSFQEAKTWGYLPADARVGPWRPEPTPGRGLPDRRSE